MGSAPAEADSAPPPTQPLPFSAEPSLAKFLLVDQASGLPAPGFVVQATSGGRRPDRIKTDAEGRFELFDSAQFGAWRLAPLEQPGVLLRIEPDLVWADPAQEARIYLDRTDTALQIEVLGATGLPVAGATVDLVRVARGMAQSYLSYASDELGRLRLSWPPSGSEVDRWLAVATHPIEGSCQPTPIEAPSIQPTTVLHLHAGARLELQVSDAARNPYGNLEVRLRSLALARNAFVQQVQNEPRYLAGDGSSVWTQLAPGEYQISIRSPIGVGWLDRKITLTTLDSRIDWVIEQPPGPIALAGRLKTDFLFVSNHYVELRDAATGELIAGTRCDSEGNFRLFGEAQGEVVLRTDLLESSWQFPPHEHRFPAGTRDVVLQAESAPTFKRSYRVLDAKTGLPVQRAHLVRAGSEFDILAGISNSMGVLEAELNEGWSYVLQADGYQQLQLTEQPSRWGRTFKLEPVN
jgi:hypothetical protein